MLGPAEPSWTERQRGIDRKHWENNGQSGQEMVFYLKDLAENFHPAGFGVFAWFWCPLGPAWQPAAPPPCHLFSAMIFFPAGQLEREGCVWFIRGGVPKLEQ